MTDTAEGIHQVWPGIRILMITTSFPRYVGDASGAFVAELATGLAAAGDTVTIVTPAASGAAREEEFEGVRVVRVGDATIGLAHQPGGILPGLRRRPWRAIQVLSMLRAMDAEVGRRAREADLIHGHWVYPGGWMAVRAAQASDVPSVVTTHGADLNVLAFVPGLRGKVRWTLERATQVLAVSGAMRDAAVRAGAPAGRLAVLPLGVAIGHDGQRSDAAGRFAGHPGARLLAVGSLTRRKGHDVLLRAFADLDPTHNPVLAILGEGPKRTSLESQARRLGIAERVTLVGNVPPREIQAWMQAADVFVLPSRSEGLGLACVEAMAAARPVIASDIPGPRELLAGGRAGMLVPPDDPGALTQALDRLLRNPSLRTMLGQQGADQVVQEGRTLGASIAGHRECYRRLLARHPRA